MFTWLKRASERAQRKNIERTLAQLIPAAAEADAEILRTGAASPEKTARVVSMQKSLLADLIGPVPLAKLREEYLHQVLADTQLGEGVKMAAQHVFDWSAKNEHPCTMQFVDWETFKQRVSGGWVPRMDTSIYQHLSFECACGENHLFGQAVSLKELPGMRLVLSCPALNASGTCVRIKGIFRPRLQSEFGAKND
jgi:hypothetical protein